MHPSRYCLQCYSPLHGLARGEARPVDERELEPTGQRGASSGRRRLHVARAAERCARCGAVQLAQDRRTSWTRERRLVRLQLATQGLVLAAVLAWTGWMFSRLTLGRAGGHGFAGVGWAVGAPLLVLVLGLDTASLITRRRSVFRMELLWPNLALAVGLGPVLLIGGVGLVVSRDAWWLSADLGRAALVWIAAWALVGFGVRRLVRRLGRGREAYLAERLRRAALALDEGR